MTTPSTPKLACPKCGDYASKVTRSVPGYAGFERRRECRACGYRFTTLETYRPPAENSTHR
jgi:transcriptional regulator NrdR family protein